MRIAIAGGIGSGKSAVTRILRDLGAKVAVADEVNAEMMRDPDYLAKLENIFPGCVKNNIVDKRAISSIVYADEDKRRALMQLSHPLIMRRMLSLYPDEPIVFYEIPLLSEVSVSFDKVWYLYCDESTRVERVMRRDGKSEEDARRIISLQKGEELLMKKADLVIKNVSDLSALTDLVKDEYYSILGQYSY